MRLKRDEIRLAVISDSSKTCTSLITQWHECDQRRQVMKVKEMTDVCLKKKKFYFKKKSIWQLQQVQLINWDRSHDPAWQEVDLHRNCVQMVITWLWGEAVASRLHSLSQLPQWVRTFKVLVFSIEQQKMVQKEVMPGSYKLTWGN